MWALLACYCFPAVDPAAVARKASLSSLVTKTCYNVNNDNVVNVKTDDVAAGYVKSDARKVE